MSAMPAAPIHIVHVIYALKIGGLENGLVNLINRLPVDGFRHTVISLTEHDDFAERIQRDDVDLIDLHKKPGHDLGLFVRLFRIFRSLRPDIVHTRNLSAIEAQIPAALAGVPARVHGEHGRGQSDPDGSVKKYQWLRRVCGLFIHRFIALSTELEAYLTGQVGLASTRISRICNGVDTERFKPRAKSEQPPHPFGVDNFIIGYVGRMDPVKDPLNLVQAFIQLHPHAPESRLVMIGDGPERAKALALLEQAGLDNFAWLPGARHQVPELLQSFDVYILPSIAEGISNTLLEAMASGLPIIATQVGGNSELISDGETGLLIDRQQSDQLAEAIKTYRDNPEMRQAHAKAARARAQESLSLEAMVNAYGEIYRTMAVT